MTTSAPPEPKHLSPAAYVCYLWGGYRVLAADMGVEPSTTWRWLNPPKRSARKKKTRGGVSLRGRIPTQYQSLILTLAKKKNLPVTADHLIAGGLV